MKNERGDPEEGGGKKDNDISHDFAQLMVKTFESEEIEIANNVFLSRPATPAALLIVGMHAALSSRPISWHRLTTNYDMPSQ